MFSLDVDFTSIAYPPYWIAVLLTLNTFNFSDSILLVSSSLFDTMKFNVEKFSQLVICILSNGRIAISTDFNFRQFLIVKDSTLGEDTYTVSIELLSEITTLVNDGQSNILSVFNDWLVASILTLRKFKQLFILRI